MAKRAHNSDELFELKWNNYSNSITEEIFNIRQNDLLVDLTFCCEGVTIGCHKLLIFACSPVLRKILSQNPSPHPIIYITDIKLSILQALLKYIYQGEVQIAKSDLVAFMKAADSFQIRGLQSKTPIENVAASSSGTEVKKRRKTPFEVGPGTSTAADPLNSMQSDQHESSNLDFSEFENECSFGADGHESVDDRFSGITVQQTMEKLKSFIRSIQNGLDILNEFEANGTLTEERREDLCQAISEFMAKGIIKGGRVGHEMIAEAAIILFPGMFDEDPKSLAESLYNRLGQQTQQRYGAESPEGYNFFQPMVQIKQENYEDSKDPISTMLVKDSSQFSIVEAATQDKYELAAKYLQMEVDSLETYLMTRRDELQNTARKLVLSVVNNPEFNFVGIQVPCNPGVDLRIDDFGTLNASVITDIVIEIKDEPVDDDDVSYISNSYFEAPQLPEISLTETDSDDKYAKATKLLRVVDVQSYLKQKRSELKHLSFKWMNDVLTNVHLDPQSYEPPGIEVDIDDQGKLFATVNCVFCQRSVRLSYKKYESSEGVKCIFNNNSNFKHFLELAKDIAKGLQYLFNENIVHRDLAARNILVTEDNQAKISDFGLARHCNVNGDYQCTNPGPIPAKWYSPEAIDNKTYTKMSDIWSFGVTMYEIFSYGEAPYQHVKCVEDLINLIKTKPLDKPDKCSVEIYEKLMQPCWKIDPKERPKINQILTTIDELLANFESFNQISTEKPIILPDDYIVKDELQ
uniref:CSON007500 protein n=1 Tax=Culicoides sonorensis TaxID=179676 RepID=A0A336KF37_CULSO